MKLESRPAVNTLLYGATILIGVALLYLARDFRTGGSNVLCGFILGAMLSGLGLFGMLIGESRSVEIDEQQRRIVLDIRRRIGGRQVVLPFNEIRTVAIVALGKPSAGTRYYDLALQLRDGREICLFGGCIFEGRMDRGRIEILRNSIERAAGIVPSPE